MSNSKKVIDANIAFYQKKDWKRYLSIIDDREGMFETWEEWHQSYLNMKNELSLYGLSVNKVVVDLDELTEFCRKKGIKIDGKARSKFVSQK